MVNRLLVTLLYVLAGVSAVYAQESSLADATRRISGQLQTVKTANTQYVQRLDVAKPAYHVTFTIGQSDSKGKAKEDSYELNLADIDPATVAYKVEKDVIAVNLEAKKGQKYIRYSENGVTKNFTDRLKLYGDNPDAARSLVDVLKKAIAAAEKAYKPTALPDNYEGLALWLKSNIGDEKTGSGSYSQALLFDAKNPLRATFRRGSTDAKGSSKEEEVFAFNVADLVDKEVKLTTKGDQIWLMLATKNRLKYIQTGAESKKVGNVSELEIVSVDPDRIRDVERAWVKLIPLAEKLLASRQPALQTLADAQKQIIAGVKTVKSGDESIEQAIKPACDCIITRKQTGGRSAAEDVYQFNLDDLAEKNAKSSISGGLYTLTLRTQDGQRLIEYYKNGLRQSYSSDVEISTDDLELFRYLPQAFEKAILACRQTRQSPVPVNSADATFNWLVKQLPILKNESETFQLTLTSSGSDRCALQLTEKITGRSTKETTFDLSLKYLNAAGTTFTVSGRNVFVNLVTNNKEKLIKTQKDGKPSDYNNTVKLQIDDINKARNIAEGFRQLIKRCPN